METYLFVAFEAEILLLLPFAGADLKAIVYVSGAQNVMQKRAAAYDHRNEARYSAIVTVFYYYSNSSQNRMCI